MRVIYMGKNKPVVCEGLEYLLENNVDVAAVVGPPKTDPSLGSERLIDVANHYDIPTTTDRELYAHLKGNTSDPRLNEMVRDIDLVISLLFWRRIRKPLIKLGNIGCINLHPAPLPEFRGLGGYNACIYESIPFWGVSAHFVDEEFDTGDIIKVYRFDINPEDETAYSLEQRSMTFLMELFKEVIDLAVKDGELPRTPQGPGRYIHMDDFVEMRTIREDEDLESIERKIRAFWYPPYGGASITVKGKEFTLVNEDVLRKIGKKYHE
ncbi:formyltransferase family protein [Candidatus Hydrogenedentota bacterium]